MTSVKRKNLSISKAVFQNMLYVLACYVQFILAITAVPFLCAESCELGAFKFSNVNLIH